MKSPIERLGVSFILKKLLLINHLHGDDEDEAISLSIQSKTPDHIKRVATSVYGVIMYPTGSIPIQGTKE